MAAQIVSGIGLLGAGVILRDGLSVRGLNTAASLWCSAAVGALAGAGMYPIAVLGTAGVITVNIVLPPGPSPGPSTQRRHRNHRRLRLQAVCADSAEAHIRALLVQAITGTDFHLRTLRSYDTDTDHQISITAELTTEHRDDRQLQAAVSWLSLEPAVTAVSWTVLTEPPTTHPRLDPGQLAALGPDPSAPSVPPTPAWTEGSPASHVPGGSLLPMVLGGFSAPGWLGLLAAVAAVGIGYLWAQRRARRLLLRFANLALLEQLVPRRAGWPRHIPAALLVLALTLLTVSLAGPTANAQVPRDRATVMLVIDVSLSMNSTDVTPTRLAAAQDAAISFIRTLPAGINLGIESFAGSATVLVSPTTNHDLAVRAVQTLKLAQSTATGDALAAALNALDEVNQLIPGGTQGPPPARIVLMSDGKQNTGRDEFAVATQAGQAHIPISTISFGTPYGTVDIDGVDVSVPVDDESLARVAQLSGGQFYPAQSNQQIHQVYDTLAHQIGYQTIRRDVSKPWLILGTLACLTAAITALTVSQRLPA